MPELYVSGLPEWDGTSSLLQAWGHKTFGAGWRRAYQVPGKKYGFITVDDERVAAEVVQRRCSWFQHGDIDCFITAEPSMGASARHPNSAARSQRHAVEVEALIAVLEEQGGRMARSLLGKEVYVRIGEGHGAENPIAFGKAHIQRAYSTWTDFLRSPAVANLVEVRENMIVLKKYTTDGPGGSWADGAMGCEEDGHGGSQDNDSDLAPCPWCLQHKGKELFHSLAACRNKAFAKVTPKPITVNVTFPEPGEADDELSLAGAAVEGAASITVDDLRATLGRSTKRPRVASAGHAASHAPQSATDVSVEDTATQDASLWPSRIPSHAAISAATIALPSLPAASVAPASQVSEAGAPTNLQLLEQQQHSQPETFHTVARAAASTAAHTVPPPVTMTSSVRPSAVMPASLRAETLKPLAEMDMQEVAEWVGSLLEQEKQCNPSIDEEVVANTNEAFRSNRICGRDVLVLTKDDLREELGIKSLAARKLLHKAFEQRKEVAPAGSAPPVSGALDLRIDTPATNHATYSSSAPGNTFVNASDDGCGSRGQASPPGGSSAPSTPPTPGPAAPVPPEIDSGREPLRVKDASHAAEGVGTHGTKAAALGEDEFVPGGLLLSHVPSTCDTEALTKCLAVFSQVRYLQELKRPGHWHVVLDSTKVAEDILRGKLSRRDLLRGHDSTQLQFSRLASSHFQGPLLSVPAQSELSRSKEQLGESLRAPRAAARDGRGRESRFDRRDGSRPERDEPGCARSRSRDGDRGRARDRRAASEDRSGARVRSNSNDSSRGVSRVSCGQGSEQEPRRNAEFTKDAAVTDGRGRSRSLSRQDGARDRKGNGHSPRRSLSQDEDMLLKRVLHMLAPRSNGSGSGDGDAHARLLVRDVIHVARELGWAECTISDIEGLCTKTEGLAENRLRFCKAPFLHDKGHERPSYIMIEAPRASKGSSQMPLVPQPLPPPPPPGFTPSTPSSDDDTILPYLDKLQSADIRGEAEEASSNMAVVHGSADAEQEQVAAEKKPRSQSAGVSAAKEAELCSAEIACLARYQARRQGLGVRESQAIGGNATATTCTKDVSHGVYELLGVPVQLERIRLPGCAVKDHEAVATSDGRAGGQDADALLRQRDSLANKPKGVTDALFALLWEGSLKWQANAVTQGHKGGSVAVRALHIHGDDMDVMLLVENLLGRQSQCEEPLEVMPRVKGAPSAYAECKRVFDHDASRVVLCALVSRAPEGKWWLDDPAFAALQGEDRRREEDSTYPLRLPKEAAVRGLIMCGHSARSMRGRARHASPFIRGRSEPLLAFWPS